MLLKLLLEFTVFKQIDSSVERDFLSISLYVNISGFFGKFQHAVNTVLGKTQDICKCLLYCSCV